MFLLPPEGSEEHTELSRALTQVRDIITAVDTSVSKYEKAQELQEVLSRVENKSLSKLKSCEVFRKDDLLGKHQQRELQHKGLVYWKTATGRLKGRVRSVCVYNIIYFFCSFFFFFRNVAVPLFLYDRIDQVER